MFRLISLSELAMGFAAVLISFGVWSVMRSSRAPRGIASTSAPTPARAFEPTVSSAVKPLAQTSLRRAENDEVALKLEDALSDLSTQDPAAAVQFVLDNIRREPQRSDLLIDIFDVWATSEPFEAARCAESLPAGPDRNHALYVVADRWNRANPTSAYIWMKNLPEFDALHLTVFAETSP